MSRTQRLFVLFGLLVSVVFLALAFSRLDLSSFVDNIKKVQILPLILAAAWYFVDVAFITARWHFLLRSIKSVPITKLFPLVCIGYMGNNVYPFRSGEVLRVWLLQRNQKVPIARALTTVIVERIFDGLVMLTFIAIGVLTLNISSPIARQAATFAAPIFLLAVVVFFILAARPNILRRIVEPIEKLLPGRLSELALHYTEEFIAGLECLRTPRDLFGMIICSYIAWLLEASVYYIVSFAFNLHVSYVDMLLVVGVVNLAGLIPASPGQIGVFELAVSSVLIAVGVPSAPATAFAVVVHVVIWLPVTVVGFLFLARQGLNLNAVTHARNLTDEPVISNPSGRG